MTLLTLEDVHAFYGEAHILQGISLTVNPGEVVTLIGRNGAGKTTTLRSIMGIAAPKRGRVRFRDEDISRLPTHEIARRGIAYVPEERRVLPNLTVLENLRLGMLGARRHGPVGIEQALDFFPRLRERIAHKGRFLSGGEFPFPVAQGSSTAGSAAPISISFRPYGVKVDFTPTVSTDGSIHLKVSPEVSTLDFANAVTISGFTIRNGHAGNAGGSSIWYLWQAPTSGSFTFTTLGSDFDTLLAVYTGASMNLLTPVASNNDDAQMFCNPNRSRLTFGAVVERWRLDRVRVFTPQRRRHGSLGNESGRPEDGSSRDAVEGRRMGAARLVSR